MKLQQLIKSIQYHTLHRKFQAGANPNNDKNGKNRFTLKTFKIFLFEFKELHFICYNKTKQANNEFLTLH